jgi:hypothetical protein
MASDHSQHLAASAGSRNTLERGRTLHSRRHGRLRHDSPRREFRDQLIEPGLDLVVETVTGCRPIALLAGELDR